MDSQFHNGTRRQRARRGVSLIEVLVVLVILVTGILTIIRLFPSGFFSIQSTGNAALADSLGAAAIDLGAQSASSLPDAILPDDLNPAAYSDNLGNALNPAIASAYSNYDPNDPNNLENARVVTNETVAVPTAVNGQSVYVVKYGPVLMPADPAQTAAQFPSYFTVNSPNWAGLSGNSAPAAIAQGGTIPPVDIPQDTLVPGREQFMVDLVNQRIAVPYAPYTLTNNTTTPPTYMSFDQRMIVVITGSDGKMYTQYLNVPQGTLRDGTNPDAPKDTNNPQGYLPDTASNYQGGWFDPTKADSTATPPTFDYGDSANVAAPHQVLPSGVTWVSVALYRPYNGLALNMTNGTAIPFSNDPYEFKLIAANIGATNALSANPGAIGFNPKAAVGSGTQARQVKISYIVSSWSILREDHDVPALTGTGSTFVVRTAVPNLKLAGSANPDNSINPGLAGSNYSLIILDLDTGKIIAPGGTPDPTNPDSPLNNEDLNGTKNDPSLINIGYALGRLTFGSDAFGDNSNNSPTIGAGTAPAHRIRIFYTADLDWTVAVQKPASYFMQVSTLSTPSETTPLAANRFVYDPSVPCIYVARCNAGKTLEVDGTYTPAGGTPQTFSQTIAAGLVLVSLNAPDVQVPLPSAVPPGTAVTFSAVRGLSARAVVAWKERNQYKVHSVDAVLK